MTNEYNDYESKYRDDEDVNKGSSTFRKIFALIVAILVTAILGPVIGVFGALALSVYYLLSGE